MGDEEYSSDDAGNAEIRWSDYIDNFVKYSATSGDLKPGNAVFLKRYIIVLQLLIF